MSILNVNQIQPVGGGNTITVTASDVSASGATITATSFVGPLTGAVTGNVTGNLTGAVTGNVTGNLTGNVTGNVTSSSTSTFSSGINVTGGRVLVGTTDAGSNGTADDLVVANNSSASDQAGISIRGGTSGRSQIFFSDGTSGQDEYRGMLRYDHSENSMQFRTDAVERLRIASDGKVGINQASPNAPLSFNTGVGQKVEFYNQGSNNEFGIGVQSSELRISSGTNSRISFFTNGYSGDERLRITPGGLVQIGTITTSSFPDRLLSVGDHTRTSSYIDIRSGTVGALLFADGTSGNTAYRGQVEYTHSDDRMCFWTAATERVRISNIGHITTKGNNQGNAVGIEIRNNNSNAYSHAELSLTSQNATTSKIWCDVPNSGLRLNYNGGSSVKIDGSGNLHVPSGAGIDFSATANSSGSMGSELLDDYEEGNWTPNFTNCTYTPTVQFGRYTKIGRYVYCTITIDGNSMSGSGTIGLEGLPFSSTEVSDNQQRSAWHPANGGHMVGLSINHARFRVNGSAMQGVKGATGNTTYMSGSQLTSGTFQFTGDFSYYTAS